MEEDYTGRSSSIYEEEVPAKVIQERIRKRKPNPKSFLSTKQYAAVRFANTIPRNVNKVPRWHEIDAKANKNGQRQLIVLDDGTEYIGEWQNNLRHGRGCHYTSEGVYEGEFIDDEYDGTGVYYLWSEVTNCQNPGRWLHYDGSWVEGKRSGQGTLYEKNEDVYEGGFLAGKKHGHGVMYYANGDVYTGEWEKDLRHGEGQLTKANGDVFEGVYSHDKRNGPGKLHIQSTKRRLEGVWKDDSFKGGSYYDEAEDPQYVKENDISGTTDGMIPPLALKDPEGVLRNAQKK